MQRLLFEKAMDRLSFFTGSLAVLIWTTRVTTSLQQCTESNRTIPSLTERAPPVGVEIPNMVSIIYKVQR